MSALLCPACNQSGEPAVRVGTIAVCASCGASVVIAPDYTVKRATLDDTTVLSPSELDTVRRARAKIVRGERRRS